MIKKLKQKKGETLVETLFSLMIAVLCVGLIYSAVIAATNINKETRALDEKYNSELNAIEGMTCTEISSEHVVIEFNFEYKPTGDVVDEDMDQVDPNATSAITEVTVYGDEESAFLLYEYERGPNNEEAEE